MFAPWVSRAGRDPPYPGRKILLLALLLQILLLLYILLSYSISHARPKELSVTIYEYSYVLCHVLNWSESAGVFVSTIAA